MARKRYSDEDALTALLTYSMQKGSVNIRALFLHNLSDALASVAVIIGGSLILLYDMWWVDPAITIGIALYILYLAVTEIGGPIDILMLGSPPDMDNNNVVSAIRSVNGVQAVHHVHLWQMQENEAALDCHVVIGDEDCNESARIKSAVKAVLSQEFGILHSTLELEELEKAHQGAQLYGHKEQDT